MELKGKIVLVTGSSKGLGLELCKQLLAKGAKVVGWSRSKTPLHDSNFEGQQVDVSSEQEVNKAFASLVSCHGTIDALINNAGFGIYGPLAEMNMQEMRDMFATNVFSIFYLSKLVEPVMVKGGFGHIVNVASIAGIMGMEKLSAYNGTKFAVKGMSEALFKELRPRGIKVTCIMPGSIETNFFDKLDGLGTNPNKMNAADVASNIIYCIEAPESYHQVNVEMRPFNRG